MARVAGTVVEIRDGRAWIECAVDAPACNACAGGRGCGWASPSGPRRLSAPHQLEGTPLSPGDSVELEADDGRLLAAAARLYLPPVAGLLGGPALLRLAGLDTGTMPLLAAVAGLVAGGLLARWLSRDVPVALLRRP